MKAAYQKGSVSWDKLAAERMSNNEFAKLIQKTYFKSTQDSYIFLIFNKLQSFISKNTLHI